MIEIKENYIRLKDILEHFERSDLPTLKKRSIQLRCKENQSPDIVKYKDWYINPLFLYHYENVKRIFSMRKQIDFIKEINTWVQMVDIWIKWGFSLDARFITITPRDLNGVSFDRCNEIFEYTNNLLLNGKNRFVLVREHSNVLPHYHLILGKNVDSFSTYKIINRIKKEFTNNRLHLDIDNQRYIPQFDEKYREKEDGHSYILKSFYCEDNNKQTIIHSLFDDLRVGDNGEQKTIRKWKN